MKRENQAEHNLTLYCQSISYKKGQSLILKKIHKNNELFADEINSTAVWFKLLSCRGFTFGFTARKTYLVKLLSIVCLGRDLKRDNKDSREGSNIISALR